MPISLEDLEHELKVTLTVLRQVLNDYDAAAASRDRLVREIEAWRTIITGYKLRFSQSLEETDEKGKT